ncbi:MAG: hypothetical protein PHX08_11210 [Lachnospiraceae bacterium]|nr:hypothetical protein [Lachnospiraceae bacterium]
MTKKDLKELIREDKEYYFGKSTKHIARFLTHNPLYRRGKYIITCRKLGYHNSRNGMVYKVLALYYQHKKNILGEKLHIEFGSNEFGRRLRIYHNDIIVNAGAVIGDNCEFYGNNCVGNKGSKFESLAAPVIGNNVSFGVGANAIGKITICNNVQISSMSLENKSITEEGLYGGIPAKLIRGEEN